MAYTPLSICNLGLGKIGQARLVNIDNPKHKFEGLARDGYPHWRDSELTKRRWRFATRKVLLPLIRTDDDKDRPYVFEVPKTALRLVRTKRTRWVRFTDLELRSPNSTEEVEIIFRVAEDNFTAEFAEVLACRVAQEMVEPVTQSNEKFEKATRLYAQALADAARLNAFELEEHTLTTPDDYSEWVDARSDPYGVMDYDG